MIAALNNIDTQIFLYLNGLHNSVLDFIMYWVSNKAIWAPLYAFLVFFLIKKYKTNSLWILLSVALLITASDQISVFIKNLVERPRPCHNEQIAPMVHLVKNHCGGAFGFLSSHASNSFALAVFLIPFLKGKIRYFTPVALSWAGIISYSRVYLGVHYPGDIVAGALLGTLLGVAFSLLCKITLNKIASHVISKGN